jgi:hypothetical protein
VTAVEEIRRAAALMRERAQEASGGGSWRYEDGESVGAWTLYDEHWNIATLTTYDTESYNYAERMPAARHPGYIDPDANGRHIASWHPAVALAIADWLDYAADNWGETDPRFVGRPGAHITPALAVARAYLGGEQP